MNICYYEYTFKHLGEVKHKYKHIYAIHLYSPHNIYYICYKIPENYNILYYKKLM